jgi:hypothetical protein
MLPGCGRPTKAPTGATSDGLRAGVDLDGHSAQLVPRLPTFALNGPLELPAAAQPNAEVLVFKYASST